MPRKSKKLEFRREKRRCDFWRKQYSKIACEARRKNEKLRKIESELENARYLIAMLDLIIVLRKIGKQKTLEMKLEINDLRARGAMLDARFVIRTTGRAPSWMRREYDQE